MKLFSKNKHIEQWLLVPGIIGFVYYALLTRFHGLNPFDVDWLLPFWRGSVDSAQHYLGWEFFRQAPLLQWPPGKSPNLGPLGGSGVALTDSLPFFALIFKPFTFWFDQPFQYFGIWVLTCFVLQAIFAWKLLTIWVKQWEQAALGTYFFCFAPIFIDRISVHLALAGHWVILAGLYLLFSPKSKFNHWLTLAAISMLVQPYLAIIFAALFFAWILIALLDTGTLSQFVKRLSIFIGVLFISGWSSGLFIFGLGSAKASGFGTYSANVLAWVDPGFSTYAREFWSRFLPDQLQSDGQYEGMNYLGSGVLLLAVFVSGQQLVRANWRLRAIQIVIIGVSIAGLKIFGSSSIMPALFLGVLCVLFFTVIESRLQQHLNPTIVHLLLFVSFVTVALTNQVFIGDVRIAEFNIPDSISNLLSVVRTSGRMLWPVTYLIIGLVLVLASRVFRRSSSIALIFFILVFQAYESIAGVGVTRTMFERSGPTEVLTSPLWEDFGERYQNIAIVLPNDNPILYPTHPDFVAPEGSFLWREVALFALKHNMSLNSFYFSRTPAKQNNEVGQVLKEIVKSGNYKNDTLYVFIDAEMWEIAKDTKSTSAIVGIINTIPVIAPI